MAWTTDAAGEPAVSTAVLRQGATAPITFACATICSGRRLGGDRDEDQAPDADDCAPSDPGSRAVPATVAGLAFDAGLPTVPSWVDQAATAGPGAEEQLSTAPEISRNAEIDGKPLERRRPPEQGSSAPRQSGYPIGR